MPLNEIPKFFSPETRALIESSLEDTWQELKKDRLGDTAPARMRLARTIVALASVGETNPIKLKWFALHATRGALQAKNTQ